jgi:hypothetical protein
VGVALLAVLCSVGIAVAEVVQQNHVRVSFQGELTPQRLPRSSSAPVTVSVAAKISPTDSKTLPQLRQMTIAINRYGQLDASGLPVCRLEQIQPATTADALSACRRSLVGEGTFSAKVLLKGQAPFPSAGKVYAFNGELNGKPAVLAHVYGTEPAPTSYTLPFVITRAKGTFGTVFKASLPQVTSDVGYVTGISLELGRNYSAGGRRHAYLSASCPAPKGVGGAVFSFAKASFAFRGGHTLRSTLTRSCRVRG